MITAQKPLNALLAEGLMSQPVEVIPQEMPLRDAARLLSQAQISGAPVVDEEGRCVGVLSAMDFMRWVESGGQRDPVHSSQPACVCSDWQMVDLELLPTDEVRWHMTIDPVTVAPDTSIIEIAQMMRDAHIHRVIVVDFMHRPVGIITSTDIVAAVATIDK